MLEMLRELLKRTVEVDCLVAQGLVAAASVGEQSHVVLAEAEPAEAPTAAVAAQVARARTRIRDRFIRLNLGVAAGLVKPALRLSYSNQTRRYLLPMSSQRVPGGVVHKLPADLRQALLTNDFALDRWKDITPLARNEFICWVEDAKKDETRARRIRRTQEELEDGMRRPCCWPGCSHRERTGS
jgi:hypothetical protein